jgi:redox-sensing transcriptional repressor
MMKPISIITIKRLSQYLQLVLEAQKRGEERISATALAHLTGVHMTQVRKDLAITGVVGVPKVGHKVDALAEAIGDFLNWNDVTEAFLIGAGHLGEALLAYQEAFATKGMKILAAFDNNPDKVDTKVHGIPVYPVEKFANLAQRLHIHIGILTVPPEQAQATADLIIQSGIRAIWNFTPTQLVTGPKTIVENVDLFASLAVLSQRLATILKNPTEEHR